MKIAIDGPAGAGKSTMAKLVAKELGLVYIDTGAMYRCAALYFIREGVDIKNEKEKVIANLDKINIEISHIDHEQHIFLNGEDVSSKIRTPEVSVGASEIAVIPEVRLKLVDIQRQNAEKTDVIMDGRDIGTYVLPDAEVKIFLTATVEERAKRRCLELQEKGIDSNYEEVKNDMIYRDKNDSSRAFAPLKPAEDSVMLDSTQYSIEEVVEIIKKIIKDRTK